MSKEYKIPLKKVILVGIIFVPTVVAVITLGDLLLLKNEFSLNKLLFNFFWFGLIYLVFNRLIFKKE